MHKIKGNMASNFDFGLVWQLDDVDEAIQSIDDADVNLSSTAVTDSNPENTDIDISINTFLAENVSKSTTYKNRCAENRFNTFLKSLNENDNRKINQIPPQELDQIMCQFFMTAKKTDAKSSASLGELYQPDSLSSFQHAWQRILVERGSNLDVKTGKDFARSRKVLASRRKQLTTMGLGNKPCATRALSDLEVDQLYSTGYFGNDSPLGLVRSMWWKITTSFGFRARDESRRLKFGDMKLLFDENNNKYLEWDKERGSKTRTGERSHSHQRSFNPRAYSTGGDRCPVRIYENFVSHRPQDACHEDSPFFLAMIPIAKFNKSEKVWYLNRPLGKNMLGEFLSKANQILSKSSASRSKISNHSARKTGLSNLLHNNINPLHVQQLSGHKNLESLNHYHTASIQQQKEMSDILNRHHHAPAAQTIATNNDSATSSDHNHFQSQSSLQNYSGFSLAGATLNNCIFINKYINEPPRKKRYIIYDSSDEE